ncbi:hypothetical protein RSOL_196090 [Rhizoctonia solani AG-3 Rhs1AP]|uniref:Uncharacterized protein n=2 Tax=Rhizoctonia solani AG-3 TaxID=1086053 RepID=A0A074RNA7_9AGAM|nr:hypothetical protein RSOL_196090 [Rhizoctonia solani AG-3 Rhs1AP]KEP48324.1 hypothetical protein V565_127610 [Rhizoctonia solani 123E]
MLSWFTDDETEWMVQNYLIPYTSFNRNDRVIYKGRVVSSMKAFISRVIEEFGRRFPYRHPDTPRNRIPAEMQSYQVKTKAEWAKLYQKFRHRFNYLKKAHGLGEDVEDGSVEGSENAGSDEWMSDNNNGTTDEATTNENTEEATTGSGSDSAVGGESEEAEDMSVVPVGGPSDYMDEYHAPQPIQDTKTTQTGSGAVMAKARSRSTSAESMVDPALDYVPSPRRMREWKGTLNELREMTSASWTGCSAHELKTRRSNVAENLRQVLDILYWGVGVECFATGAIVSPISGHQGFCTSSSRLDQFLYSGEGIRAMKSFNKYAVKSLGPALCTVAECPGPVVYGDLDRENHPVMPRDESASTDRKRIFIFDYQRHKLRWQGGGLEVPYHRIQSDAENQRYDIVRVESIPAEVPYLENPLTMPHEHVEAWFRFLVKCDSAQLPEDRQFQFARPILDGPEVNGYQAIRAPGIRMNYGPDAHSYALYVQGLEQADPAVREDGLPQFYEGDSVYFSVTPVQLEYWRGHLPGHDDYVGLLQALKAHDAARPFEAPVEFWAYIAELMPHLKPEVPSPEAGIRQFRTEKGRLLNAFFDFQDPAFARACLHHCLDWCRAQHFVHPLSGTVMGGPFSVKWAVLFLGHLELNVRRVMEDPAGSRAHYAAIADHVEIHFTETDRYRIRHAITSLTSALEESTTKLMGTLGERRLPNPHDLAVTNSAQAHSNFLSDLEGFTWFSAVGHDSGDLDASQPVTVNPTEAASRGSSVILALSDKEPIDRKGKRRAPVEDVEQTIIYASSSRKSERRREKQRRVSADMSQSEEEGLRTGAPDNELSGLSIAGPSTRTRSKSQGRSTKSSRKVMEVVIDRKKK